MYTKSEATEERVQAYLTALEREKDGYQTRIGNLEAGMHETLTTEQLEARIGHVDAEIDRVKKTGKAKKKDA
jgi:uncharacterized small protein (DUF1192 family)